MKGNEYFIEWPEINFEEIRNYYVENRVARILYKGVIIVLFAPQIIIQSFWEVLRFKV